MFKQVRADGPFRMNSMVGGLTRRPGPLIKGSDNIKMMDVSSEES